jgi:alanine racemase
VNLQLSIEQICAVTGARFIEDPTARSTNIIQNIVIDSRSPLINSSTLFVVFKGERVNGADFVSDFKQKSGRYILTEKALENPGVSQLIVDNVTTALQAIAAFHRERFDFPVIAITGSNGKTTVKEWLYHVLKDHFKIVRSPKSYNSQIGVALSLLEMRATHDLAIIEAGISKQGEMEHLEKMIQPTIGVFTGLGKAHQEGFSSMEEKKTEKFNLFKHCNILIEASEEQIQLKKNNKRTTFSYQVDDNGFLTLPDLLYATVALPFAHPGVGSNASLTAVTAKLLGLEASEIMEKLQSLPAISMRLEKIKGNNGNLIINDAYSVDEQSLELGLRFLEANRQGRRSIVFLAEDPLTTSSNSTLLNMIQQYRKTVGVDALYYIGAADIANQFDFITATFSNASSIHPERLNIHDSVVLFTGSRVARLERIVAGFTEKKHITRLEINLAAMRHNLQYFRKKIAPETRLLAMVKSQAYGGGLTEIAAFLEQQRVDYFGVAYADEGVALRRSGVQIPVIVMNPEPAAFDEIIEYALEPAIYSLQLLDQFIHHLILRGVQNFPIHLKLETGMNRLGFQPEAISELSDVMNTQPEVYVASIFSHLSVSDLDIEREFTSQQIELFNQMTLEIEQAIGYQPIRHLANSAGVLNYPAAHFDMVRLGIGLFGLMKGNETDTLEPVLRFMSQISQVRQIQPGESVGYGRAFRSKNNTWIGVVPVGYGDGLRRHLSNGQWRVKIQDKFYPIIGRICMDMCMIDLGETPLPVGAEVQLFGPGNSVEEMAEKLDTIPYEILTSISGRVQRIYLE